MRTNSANTLFQIQQNPVALAVLHITPACYVHLEQTHILRVDRRQNCLNLVIHLHQLYAAVMLFSTLLT